MVVIVSEVTLEVLHFSQVRKLLGASINQARITTISSIIQVVISFEVGLLELYHLNLQEVYYFPNDKPGFGFI